jgi:hypothetical protein
MPAMRERDRPCNGHRIKRNEAGRLYDKRDPHSVTVTDTLNCMIGAGGGAVGAAVVAFVGDDGAERYVQAEMQKRLEHGRVGLLAAGDLEGERMAVEVGLQMDLRGVTAA